MRGAVAYSVGIAQPQRGIAEAVDASAASTVPGLERSVTWGMAQYGVGDGWCFPCGGFDDHVKLISTGTPRPALAERAVPGIRRA